jgi:hypothetical protein
VDISSHNVGIKNFHPDKRSVFKLSLANLEADPINLFNIHKKKELEDTKGASRIRKSEKDRQHNGQKKNDKQRSTKHYR